GEQALLRSGLDRSARRGRVRRHDCRADPTRTRRDRRRRAGRTGDDQARGRRHTLGRDLLISIASPKTPRNRERAKTNLRVSVARGIIVAGTYEPLWRASASAPNAPPRPPGPTLDEKMAWILRLEDQRVLRDPPPPVAPPAPVRGRKPAAVPSPPPPPDLV